MAEDGRIEDEEGGDRRADDDETRLLASWLLRYQWHVKVPVAMSVSTSDPINEVSGERRGFDLDDDVSQFFSGVKSAELTATCSPTAAGSLRISGLAIVWMDLWTAYAASHHGGSYLRLVEHICAGAAECSDEGDRDVRRYYSRVHSARKHPGLSLLVDVCNATGAHGDSQRCEIPGALREWCEQQAAGWPGHSSSFCRSRTP